jgi:hypothetical protein
MVAPTWITPGRVQFLENKKRFHTAWTRCGSGALPTATTSASLPGASFVVNGAAQAHDSALTTASIEMKWINGWSAAATFEGEFAQLRRQGRRALYVVTVLHPSP